MPRGSERVIVRSVKTRAHHNHYDLNQNTPSMPPAVDRQGETDGRGTRQRRSLIDPILGLLQMLKGAL